MNGHVIDPLDGVENPKLGQHAKAFIKECRAETLDVVVQLAMAMERLMFGLLSGYAVTPDDPDVTRAVERSKKDGSFAGLSSGWCSALTMSCSSPTGVA
ncbi:hypothetical protein QBC32DRAFT_329596 [Pseudoneurospora amorphoporcata]|uniref:Uncharacterized protein n=1 Tax=Pseudoneurospora amorphoporcata TaxID=241081 RepID=A0AAN6P624_9PEZI|nr:hypothetical protein QBC32DRAFT_329596 [Pseudoneurospora amorphoporcata]